MNVYDVNHVNGDVFEVEADFYEQRGADYVFYAGDEEVLRVPWIDAMSIAKSPIRARGDLGLPEFFLQPERTT